MRINSSANVGRMHHREGGGERFLYAYFVIFTGLFLIPSYKGRYVTLISVCFVVLPSATYLFTAGVFIFT
jgi:hypothetical protein